MSQLAPRIFALPDCKFRALRSILSGCAGPLWLASEVFRYAIDAARRRAVRSRPGRVVLRAGEQRFGGAPKRNGLAPGRLRPGCRSFFSRSRRRLQLLRNSAAGDVGQAVQQKGCRTDYFQRITAGRLSKKFIQRCATADRAVSREFAACPDRLYV
jgi:hypothetical protein